MHSSRMRTVRCSGRLGGGGGVLPGSVCPGECLPGGVCQVGCVCPGVGVNRITGDRCKKHSPFEQNDWQTSFADGKNDNFSVSGGKSAHYRCNMSPCTLEGSCIQPRDPFASMFPHFHSDCVGSEFLLRYLRNHSISCRCKMLDK